MNISKSKQAEIDTRQAIEKNCKLIVHDANIIFQQNCANIDLVVYGKSAARYVQVKCSTKPARPECVVVAGSPWTEGQLFGRDPIFNKKDGHLASHIIIADYRKDGTLEFYIAPPDELEPLLRRRGRKIAAKPKRDGGKRSIGFRKELERDKLEPWRGAWHLLAD
jgi:hypothetical protein